MLQRDKQPMLDFVKEAIVQSGVKEDYENRPEYQRNDYLMWINGATKMETKQKRLDQMISELKTGGVYMKMDHPASRKNQNTTQPTALF